MVAAALGQMQFREAMMHKATIMEVRPSNNQCVHVSKHSVVHQVACQAHAEDGRKPILGVIYDDIIRYDYNLSMFISCTNHFLQGSLGKRKQLKPALASMPGY